MEVARCTRPCATAVATAPRVGKVAKRRACAGGAGPGGHLHGTRANAGRTQALGNASVSALLARCKELRCKLPVLEFAVVSPLLVALPARAEEAGKLFDFDATLPIMAAQFLLLMVFLDKTWFSPVGKVLDDRDEKLRDLLAGVQDNSSEVGKYEEEAKELVADARTQAAQLIDQTKKDAEAEGNAQLNAVKERLEKQYDDAMAELEREEDQARKDLEPEIEKLAKSIVSKVL